MKKILILGGTNFIGRVLVEELIKDFYSITLFNRGKTNPGLFPQVNKIIGDRETDDINKLLNQDWDVIIDISSYYPLTLEKFIDKIKGKVGRYIFISSVSVYDMEKFSIFPAKEDFELLPCSLEEKTDKTMHTYGKRKAECERAILSKDWLDKIIFRPSLVYGKYDYTDRLYYWLYRINSQKEVLIPESRNSKSDYTFVDDFAKIIIESINIKTHSSVYNAVTHDPVSLNEIINSIIKISGKRPEFVTAPDKFLEDNKVSEWLDLPLWLKDDMKIDNSILKRDFQINFNSFEESLRNTYEYYEKLGWNEGKYGLSVEKEHELINILKNSKESNYD